MNAKVAIPIWDGRVSPVMDTARQLLIIEVVDDAEVSRKAVDLPLTGTPERARRIADLNIDILICGALSRDLDQLLEAGGIERLPWYRGPVEEILTAYVKGELCNEYLMPGCRRRGGLGRGRQCRRRTGSGQAIWQKEKP